MTAAERWERIKEVFAAALERAASDRFSYVREVCGDDAELYSEVWSLLQAHERSGGFIEQPAIERVGLTRPDAQVDWQGKRLGNYRIVSEIGRGGMSHVYKAVRDDDQYYKEVAIKLLRPGLDTHALLQRLRAERQILAELSHPHIAQLLDGGVTETKAPYLVMEYIEGRPIDWYCEERQLGLRARLDLICTLCSAVHYVHQHLMVHGDLKGGNILVTNDGVVKLLDFGIAKLLNATAPPDSPETTMNRVVAMTPAYASPEQVRGEPITTTSDVYSLGVLLYRLLTGTLPFEVPSELFGWETAAHLSERTPRPPSVVAAAGSSFYRGLARELEGDLDAIVMKALSKAPEDRYGSAEQLSEDLRRYLRGFPVHARPDRPMYRIEKLVKRHKAASVATGLFVVALLAGICLTTWQTHVARVERERAERHLTEIRKLSNTYLRDVYDAAVNLPGATAIRKILVENSLKHISALESEAQDSLEFQRELAWAYQKFGDVQGDYLGANLGDTEGAVQSYRRALRLRESIAQRSDATLDKVELVRSYVALSELLAAQSKLDEAIELAKTAVSVGDRLVASPDVTKEGRRYAAAAHMLLGTNVSTVDLSIALQSLNTALAAFERLAAEASGDPRARLDIALVHARIGFAYLQGGHFEEALRHRQLTSNVVEELVLASPLDSALLRAGAFSNLNVGEVHNKLRQPHAALPHLQLGLQRVEHLQKTDPANEQAPIAVAYALNLLSDSYLLQNDPAEALKHLNRAAEIIARGPPAKPTDIAEVRLLAGSNSFRLGKTHAALAKGTETAARRGEHRKHATAFLERSIDELRPLKSDPVIGKEASQLTEEAEQLLRTLS
jgi:non-specific serine/threonine protein kinase/serine/threonine-protein kinase